MIQTPFRANDPSFGGFYPPPHPHPLENPLTLGRLDLPPYRRKTAALRSRNHAPHHALATFLSLILASLVSLLPSLASAQEKTDKGYVYIVQPGDSCWSIAENLFGNGKRYDLIHKHNNLGPMPHILQPGQKIYLPVSIPLPDAQIAWLRRTVRTKPPNSIDWYKAKKEMRLWRLYRVTTGQHSAALIRFEDRSALNLREKSLVVIYGDQGPQKQTRREIKKSVVLEEGTIKGGLASLYGGKTPSPLSIRTPSGQVELASQSSQIEVDPSKTSIVSVYQGQALVQAQGSAVTVPEDFGTRVEKGKKPEKPRRLPPRVEWASPERKLSFFVLQGFRGTASIRWTPLPQASVYRVELALDPNFREPLRDLITHATSQDFDELEPGTYYARLAAIDSFKLEGKPSDTLKIEILPLSPSPRLILPRPGAAYETIGLLKLSPPSSPTEYSLDRQPFQPFREPLRFSIPKRYNLSLRPQGSTDPGSPFKIRLLDVQTSLQGPSSPIKLGSKPSLIRISLRDSQGRPASLQDLRLTAFPGSSLPLQTTDQVGVFTAYLPSPAVYPGHVIYLTLSWAGGDLQRISIPVEPPPHLPPSRHVEPPPPPPTSEPPPEPDLWKPTPIASKGLRLAPASLALSASPLTYAGMTLHFADFEAPRLSSPPNESPKIPPRSVGARLALRGEIALLSQRLGLDLDLPILQAAFSSSTDPTLESASSLKFGDISLGARYAFPFADKGLTLAAGFRLGIPTSGFPRPFRPGSPPPSLAFPQRDENNVLLQPLFALDWTFAWLTLQTHQSLAFSTGFGPFELFYAGSATAQIRPLPLLSFALEGNWQIPFLGSGVAAEPDVFLSAAARLHLGRFRLSLFGGFSPLLDSSRWFGSWHTGFSFDIAFPG